VTNKYYLYSKKEASKQNFSFAGIVAKSWQNMANWRKQKKLLSLLRLK
jgi:hypothetical protein